MTFSSRALRASVTDHGAARQRLPYRKLFRPLLRGRGRRKRDVPTQGDEKLTSAVLRGRV